MKLGMFILVTETRCRRWPTLTIALETIDDENQKGLTGLLVKMTPPSISSRAYHCFLPLLSKTMVIIKNVDT